MRGPLAEAAKRALVARVDQAALPCPARGLELVVARFGDGPEPRVELNLNDGPRMARRVALDASDEPRHWFVLDAAIGRRHGRALAGPPPEEAFPPIPRSLQLAAIGESLDWYAEHEPDNRKAVLTAARGWRYIAEGRSVVEGGGGRLGGRAPAGPDARAGGRAGGAPGADLVSIGT